jgi:hypothetical protein
MYLPLALITITVLSAIYLLHQYASRALAPREPLELPPRRGVRPQGEEARKAA